MLLSVLICFYGKKISVSEFLRSARSSFLLFPIKKENRQRLYNLLSIFILKLIIKSHFFFQFSTAKQNFFILLQNHLYFTLKKCRVIWTFPMTRHFFPIPPTNGYCSLEQSKPLISLFFFFCLL